MPEKPAPSLLHRLRPWLLTLLLQMTAAALLLLLAQAQLAGPFVRAIGLRVLCVRDALSFTALCCAAVAILSLLARRRLAPALRRWWTLRLALIPATLIGTCFAATLFLGGPIRYDFLASYKTRDLLNGKLYYRPDWGWMDKAHYRPDHFLALAQSYDQAAPGMATLSLEDGWITPLRIRVRFRAEYLVPKTGRESAQERWLILATCLTDFMNCTESIQQASPWYHGNQLSAWQFDDFSSAIRTSLDYAPAASTPPAALPLEEALALWRQQALDMVKAQVRLDNLHLFYPSVTPAHQEDLRQRLHTLQARWSLNGQPFPRN